MTNPKFLVGGKPPSMSLIESTYLYTGIENDILPLREKLSIAVANLERYRSRLDLYKEFLNMWRTLSASERVSIS